MFYDQNTRPQGELRQKPTLATNAVGHSFKTMSVGASELHAHGTRMKYLSEQAKEAGDAVRDAIQKMNREIPALLQRARDLAESG